MKDFHETRIGATLEKTHTWFRMMTAAMVSPILRLTGYRFSKNFRHGVTYGHRSVYAMVDTVHANLWAGMEPDPDIVKFLED